MSEIDRCITEQARCAEYLRGDGGDKAGAMRGATDWTAEECLLRNGDQYASFLERKSQLGGRYGFEPLWMPSFLFGFQQSLVNWALVKGRAAILADCGLGKTPMFQVWAENIVRKTGKRVLVLTPSAVGAQTVREGEKFGIECRKCPDGKIHSGINVINYERLHYLNPSDFIGVVADESSILKSYAGKRRAQITEFMRALPYRLLTTATAAPNDHIELGTSSEALGELGYIDMLSRYFKNDQHTIKPMRYTGFGAPRTFNREHTDKWRFKGHAEIPFYQFVSSWARACRKPSDLGFPDTGYPHGDFILPELIEREHIVTAQSLPDGMLFPCPAIGLKEQREERRRTIVERCEKVAELCGARQGQSLIWCQLNPEGKLLRKIVPDCEEIAGDTPEEKREELFAAFVSGQLRRLATKEKIAGWGLNLQNCDHMTRFPSHSYEAYYQGVRRCWRFGQKNPVTVDIVRTEGEQSVMENMQRKSEQADKMFSRLVECMDQAMSVPVGSTFASQEAIPGWLR